MTDVLLIQRFTEGDERAFNELYKRYDIFLRKLFIKQTGDFDRLNDVMQETWVKVYQQASEKYEPRSRFINWLTAIAINVYKDSFRKRIATDSKKTDLLPDLLPLSEVFVTDTEQKDREEALQHLKQGIEVVLGGHHREVMVLRTYTNLTFNEVTEMMEYKDRQAAINAYTRAIDKLKKYFHEGKRTKCRAAKTRTRS